MEQFLVFIMNHWILSAVWLVFFILVILNESARGGAQLSPQQATRLINSENAVVLDVRKKDEFKTGHLPNSLNIPATNISNRLGELEPYRNKPIILVCKTGTTTGTVGATLKKAGFENVTRLKGGITEWLSNNLPLVKS
ncbi:rhodanese-like domain-containing protein [Gynuella sp.]|uniref:rhodanese-like domain-containing protein n=1 Tax=Gynuella sp. TaxID=2969146 RepID=UPI003D0E56D9